MSNSNSSLLPSSPTRPFQQRSRFRRPFHIPPNDLPVCGTFSGTTSTEADSTDDSCQLWNPEWNSQITTDGEKFLEEAACLGYTEDQSLAVLYVCKFDVQMARDRLPKFRNIYVPNWSEPNRLLFEELLNSHGKAFSSFRTTKLGNIPVKELVNYYYYQKQLKKSQRRANALMTRRAMQGARRRMTTDYLNSLRVSSSSRSGETVCCASCFKRKSGIFYKFGLEYKFCSTCYSYFRSHNALPPSPVMDDSLVFSLPASSPTSAIENADDPESCKPAAVKSQTVGLFRLCQKNLQNLDRAKHVGPTATEHGRLMTQMKEILKEQQPVRPVEVITLDC